MSDAEQTIAEDIPVTGTDSIVEALRNPSYIEEWLTGLEAPDIEKTRQGSGDARSHTVGENIVRNWGLRPWGVVLHNLENIPHPVTGEQPHTILQSPRSLLDALIHISEMDGWRLDYDDDKGLTDARKQVFDYLTDPGTSVSHEDLEAVGGTDALVHGPMGRGKTTVVQTLIARIMEINNEAVVWRGTAQRTEWLPFAPWTILCLPADVDYDIRLSPPEEEFGFDDSVSFDPITVPVKDIVWQVRRYDDIEDLNKNVLTPGAFHVVYPDPYHRGAEETTIRAEETKVLKYTSPRDTTDPNEVTPPSHWWFSWLTHHNSFGRSMRLTWVCDEASNLFEDHASNDDHNLDRRINAIGQQYVDFRRNGLTFILLTQKAREISWKIRKKMRWCVPLSGSSNAVGDDIIGANPPMNTDITSHMALGRGICWTAGSYADFDWDPIPKRLKVPGKLRINPEVMVS